jgi:SET domain
LSGIPKNDDSILAALEVRETQHKGCGVFTTAPIAAGTRIVAIAGQKYRTRDIPPEALAMQIDDDLWLCSEGENLDDYINHSCAPNIGFIHNDPVLYALRDIAAAEELTWDYSTSISESGWNLACLCEAKSCRGTVLPFGELTLEQQKRLAPLALAYLQNRSGRLTEASSLR